jgi:hypothetical protein
MLSEMLASGSKTRQSPECMAWWGATFRGEFYRSLMQESYLRFVIPELQKEPIKQVWGVGRSTVASALKEMPLVDAARVIPLPGWNPGAFRSAVVRMAQEIAECLNRKQDCP